METPSPEAVSPIKVLHVITGLGAGGAERQLATLVLNSNPVQVRHEVVSLLDDGVWGARLRERGVPVRALHVSGMVAAPLALWRLARVIRRSRADIVQTWLYHADLAGLLADGLAGAKPLIWSLRCSSLRFDIYGAKTQRLIGLLAWLSRFPTAVVANSAAGANWHRSLGYRARRWHTIANGIDCAEFHPDPEARRTIRTELGIADDVPLIGNLSRHDPMKDHPTLLAAFARQRDHARLVLAGDGTEPGNVKLTAEIAAAGIDPTRVLRLGPRRDVPRLLAALDVAVLSSSFGEGFPNIVAEAMACGIPCAATAVGDTPVLIGDCGTVVPPGDPQALATAIDRLVSLSPADRATLGRRARLRIESDFSIAAMVSAYADLYRRIRN